MKLSIVSYLDNASSDTVRRIQRELSAITGSTASLSSWEPHVTIGDGVVVDQAQLEELKHRMRTIASQTAPFSLALSGIGSLDNWKGGAGETPYVIYLDVIPNESLLALVRATEIKTSDLAKWYIMPRPYLPHATLAFRDLGEEGYHKGLAYLSTLNPMVNASIDHIALVEKLPETDQELTRFELA